MTLAQFVKTTRDRIQSVVRNNGAALIVTGNESADMDSCASSMLAAYLCSKSNPVVPVIPLINIPRADFKTRPDIVYLFDKLGLGSDHLVFQEDLAQLRNCKLSGFLVDHNRSLVEFDRVQAVIDHHADESLYPEANPRIIEKSGSCVSLVARYFLGVIKDPTVFHDFGLVEMGLAPLLLDTSNMEHRVEESDVEAFKFFKSMLSPGEEIDTLAFFTTLEHKKKDLSALSVNDILKKDYKQWQGLGISSVPKSLNYLMTRNPKLKQEMEGMAKERGLDVYAIMTSYQSDDGKFHRELAIHTCHDQAATGIQKFVTNCSEELQLSGKNELTDLSAFEQGKVTCSRKQVAPMLREALQGTLLGSL